MSDIFSQDLEDMDLAGEKVTEAPKYATDQDGVISKAQAKRMFALAKGDADLVRQTLKGYGYERSEQVKKTEYDVICGKIEAAANLTREPGDELGDDDLPFPPVA